MENLLIFMFETNFFLKNVVNQKHVCGAPRLRDLRSRQRPLGHEVPRGTADVGPGLGRSCSLGKCLGARAGRPNPWRERLMFFSCGLSH